MNLWAKRVGQLAISAVALFFFSCEEETNLIGFPNPDSKYQNSYIEIPLSSSTMLFDSIRTTNFAAANDLNRLLAGQFSDPIFGNITSSAYTQFIPAGTLKSYGDSTNKFTFILDSAYLHLALDSYAYGTDGTTTQKLNVYELDAQLPYNYTVTIPGSVGGQQQPTTSTYNFPREYYTYSNPSYYATPIGTTSFSIRMDRFNSGNISQTVSTKLSSDFANRLFELAETRDSTFTTFSIFNTKFPGLAIKPENGMSDKIVGFNPIDDTTTVTLYYHTVRIKDGKVKDDSLLLEFNLSNTYGLVSFNKIETDRSATDLSGLGFYTETDTGNKRYIQAGTGVVTTVDFSALLDSLKDIPRLAIHSAEIIISSIDDNQHFIPPSGFVVKLIKDNNRPRKLSYLGKSTEYQSDVADLNAYSGFVNFDTRNPYILNSSIPYDSTFNVVNDGGGFFTLKYSETAKNYSGVASLFFKRLHAVSQTEDNERTLFTKAVLIPYEQPTSTAYGRHINGKTLNRVSFNKDALKLRVYYTIPTVNEN